MPWLRDVGLDEEDGVALDDRPRVASRSWNGRLAGTARALRVAVVALPYLSNVTDFDALATEGDVDLAYAERPADLDDADVVILPGTKATLGALDWLEAQGFRAALMRAARDCTVVGICGGYQMLGTTVADPHGVEGGGTRAGLALLPVSTVLATEKITQTVRITPRPYGWFGGNGAAFDGYEIHMGISRAEAACDAFADLVRSDGTRCADGGVSPDRRILGTYVHGLFEDDTNRHAFVRAARDAAALEPPRALRPYGAQRQMRFDRLGEHVRASLDLSSLLQA